MGKRPNIIMFLAEDLDLEGINAYNQFLSGFSGLYEAVHNRSAISRGLKPQGRLLTPTLDNMAAQGAIFDRYYCTSPVCTPARYTVLTGRLAERSAEFQQRNAGEPASIWFNTPISETETLLPKALKSAGYRTGLFGKWHNFPADKGAEIERLYNDFPAESTWEDPRARKAVHAGYLAAVNFLKDGDFGWDVVDRLYYGNPEPIRPVELSDQNIDWVVEGATKFIKDQQASADPFFAYVAVSLPHGRYVGSRFINANPLSSPAGLLDKRPEVMPTRQSILDRVRKAGMQDSACEGLWLDEAVKAVLKAVKDAGHEEDTCVIFTTDHPTAGKGTTYLGRIPLIIKWPGHTEGIGHDDHLLSETDLAPTVLDIGDCSCPPDMRIDGRSFKALLTGDEYVEREELLMELTNMRSLVRRDYKYVVGRLPHDTFEERAARDKVGWLAKFIWPRVYWYTDESFPAYFETDQLYDLNKDPLEQRNAAMDIRYRDVLADMKARMRAELCRLPSPYGEFTPNQTSYAETKE